MTDLYPCGHPLPSRKWWESSSRQCDLWGRYEDGKCYMHSVSAEAVAKRAAKSAKQSASHARQKDPSSATSTAYEKRWCDALLANPTTHTRCWRIGRFPDGRCARHTTCDARPLHHWRSQPPLLPDDVATWTPESRASLMLVFASIEQL